MDTRTSYVGVGGSFSLDIQPVFALLCLVAVCCDEAVHIAAQKARGQHNTIPPAFCGSVSCAEGADWFGLPD